MGFLMKFFDKYINRPAMLGLLLVLSGVLSYFLVMGIPVYGTNDDVFMNMVAAGALHYSEPSSALIFIHPLYGWLVSSLYVYSPDIPWYALLFMVIISFSVFVINAVLLRGRKDWPFFFLVLLATYSTIFISLWHLQFTIVAGLATLAGGILLINTLYKSSRSKITYIFEIITGIMLIIIGLMIRFNSALLVGLLLASYVAIIVFERFKSHQKPAFTKKEIFSSVVVGIAVITSIVGLNISKAQYYSGNGWQQWFALNALKAEFIDFNRIHYKQSSHVFDSVGWTRNDFNMIMSWQHVDTQKFSAKKFSSVVKQYREINLVNNEEDLYIRLKSKLSNLVNNEEGLYILLNKLKGVLIKLYVDTEKIYGWLFLLFIFALLAIQRNKQLRAVIPLVFVFVIIYGYLYFGLNRTPFRVLILIHIALLWIILSVSTYSEYQKSLTFKIKHWHTNTKILLGIAIVGVILLYNSMNVTSHKERRLTEQKNLKNIVKQWQTQLPKNSIIYVVGDSLRYEHHLPLTSLSYFRKIKGFIGTGWPNQTPLQQEKIKSLGLTSNDFYGSLSEVENVYTVGSSNDVLKKYYEQHYNIKMTIEQTKIPLLFKVKFTKLK